MNAKEFKDNWIGLADRFYRVAYHILESEADAQDAVQDLFVKLWKMRATLETVKNPAAFGITVIRNICLDRIRSSAISRTDRPQVEELDNMIDTSDEIDSWLIRKENLDRIRACIARLPDNQRKVLEMRVFKNLPYQEISLLTGLSEVNVRVKLSNARKNLKKLIDNEDNR